ncbi:MAG: hypothetical protein IJX91_04735 [Clostridia bacterium]|nr:hypothetical protein [Clostridia bacterium]
MKKRKAKQEYVDDGHTVYDMDGIGRTDWWSSRSKKPKGKTKEENPVGLTRKERWAAIRAAMSCYLPMLLVILVGFGLAMVLMFFWLR